jgi:hypothetical protein
MLLSRSSKSISLFKKFLMPQIDALYVKSAEIHSLKPVSMKKTGILLMLVNDYLPNQNWRVSIKNAVLPTSCITFC